MAYLWRSQITTPFEFDADGWLTGVRREPTVITRGRNHPELVVMHYTATSADISGTVNALTTLTGRTSRKVSSHFLIAHEGEIIQLAPLDLVTLHAGESLWGGRPKVNGFSIGIEIVNLGWLTRDSAGVYRDHAKRVYTGPVHTTDEGRLRHWADYDQRQIAAAYDVDAAVRRHYQWQLGPTVGHSDISLNGKVDPGPAFWARWQLEHNTRVSMGVYGTG